MVHVYSLHDWCIEEGLDWGIQFDTMCTSNTQLVGGRNWLNGWQEHRTPANGLEQTWTHWSAWRHLTVNGHPMLQCHQVSATRKARSLRWSERNLVQMFSDVCLRHSLRQCFEHFWKMNNLLSYLQHPSSSDTNCAMFWLLSGRLSDGFKIMLILQIIAIYCSGIGRYWKVMESHGKLLMSASFQASVSLEEKRGCSACHESLQGW